MAPAKTSGGQRASRPKKRKATKRPSARADGRQMSLLEQSVDYINRNGMRLIKKYPGECVIALGNRIIAHGYDLEEVSACAERKAGEDIMSALLHFVPESVEDACVIF